MEPKHPSQMADPDVIGKKTNFLMAAKKNLEVRCTFSKIIGYPGD